MCGTEVYSISVVVSWQLVRDAFRCLEPISSPSLSDQVRVSIEVCLQHGPAASSSALALTSCVFRSCRSASGETFGPCQVLPERAHGPDHLCGPLDFHKCVGAFQNPYLPAFG